MGELKNGRISEYTIDPGQFGVQTADIDAIRVPDVAEATAMLIGVLENVPGPALDIVLLNAGATLYVAGMTDFAGSGGR